MACFLVPAAEAVVVTSVKAGIKRSAEKNGLGSEVVAKKMALVQKLTWLTNLLWGGSVLLAFEHVWHGEIVPWFPFLTAAATPDSASEMLFEMGTIGVGMAVLVTLAWGAMVLVTDSIKRRAAARA
ncbi:MAG: hypothetical protein SPK50_09250 [Mobiluncus porci]|uniref:Uncharacterized protein n=1 Tax=Mobiluncus porci TaxID=2652278 RepID=A0A7K0K5J3_9ACTO|nr:hypothetical protein [Mobiluncus porci]MDD7541036.1 hypothetical protein [Mobiluncus porci]MDY5749300.1 hypothetical protein [Mobiluncus porci]MST50706.1 hypothetical protein [Mobiluncus porci]